MQRQREKWYLGLVATGEPARNVVYELCRLSLADLAAFVYNTTAECC